MRTRLKPESLAGTFNELRADFRAGKDTRFVSKLTGVSGIGSGQDYHYRSESQWLHMLERCRHYQRNDQVVGQGIRRVVANIIQDGFRLDIDTGDKALDAELRGRWDEWSTSPDLCHSEGELVFSEIEQLVLSSVITDGDVFGLPLSTGALQMVEAHRCRTPRNTTRNVVHGVLLNDDARRQEYWFTREDLNPLRSLNRVADIKPYPARDSSGQRQVLHLYMPYRFSQRRGVSCLAPVSDTVGMHDDVQFATLVKAQMQALIALLRERSKDWEPIGNQQMGEQSTETSGGYTRTIEGVGAGMEIAGDPGETLKMFSADIPNAEFFPHTRLLLTFIAINLDLPVHVLLLDPSQTNFSGWRGAIDQARLRFRQIQAWMVSKFHCPVYKWWLQRQVATVPEIRQAASRTGIKVGSHRWNPPQFPYIDPQADAAADDMQISRCLNSRRRIQAARGRDQNEVAAEIVADNSEMIVLAALEAKRLNDEHDIDVDWRELLSLPLPDKVSSSLPLSAQGTPEPRAPQNPAPPPPDGNRVAPYLNGRK